MKKTGIIIVVIALMFGVFFFAMQKPAGSESNQPLSQKLVDSGVKIIDIRTQGEWMQTGIVPGAFTLTYFDEKGNYNNQAFLSELEKIVPDKNEKFGIICRSGNRTSKLLPVLHENGYPNAFDVLGGVKTAKDTGVTLVPYK
jgi:rhodanese-related sulfurtransferase